MKKITRFLAIIVALISTVPMYAGIDPTTAWWNAETFESYAAGTTLKTGWTDNGGSPYVLAQTVTSPTTGTATGIVHGFCINNVTALTEVSQGGNRGVYKSFDNALTGLVYVKTSAYTCTNGTTYSLKNSSGTIVFEFGGISNTANAAFWFTGKTTTEVALGNRAKWFDIECILDLNNNVALQVVVTYNGTSKTFTNIALPAGGDIKRMDVTMIKGYEAAGLDNTTFGSLLADGIKDLTGVDDIQTLSNTVTNDYSVTEFATAMGQDNVMAKKDLDITWSISDWGTLSTEDQALVSLTRSSTDFRTATLSAGNISADATITLQAVYGSTTITKLVNLKALTVDGLKAGLADEITKSNNLMSAVTDANPYISDAKTTLTGFVTAAQAVIDNSSATIEQASTALSNIQDAEVAFSSTMAPYNDFVTFIGTVQAAYDAETRTATFITTEKATLNTAIQAAVTAKTTIATMADIVGEQGILVAAYSKFNAEIPVYASLENQIATVTARLAIVTPRTGTAFLMFPAANVDALTTAKTTAEGVLANGTTAVELGAAQTALASALTTFNALPRVAPSSTNKYKIYTYGVDNGDGGTTKSILYVETSTGTVKYATPDNTAVENTEWTITEESTGYYSFLNSTTNTYLNGTTTSATDMLFTLPEGFSQTNLISASTDSYLIYYIVNPSNKGLEVDLLDAGTSTGVFIASSAPANRFRFCYQFEPVSPGTGLQQKNVSSIKVYMANDKAVIDGISTGDGYSVYNAIGVMVKSDFASSNRTEITLPASGLYVIKTNGQSFKIIK